MLKAFAIAFFLIFIILATMFNSLVQPFIVMLAIPFGIVGVIFAFLIHGRPLSFFAFFGLVGLTGIVVNDSIVLMDFVNKLRKAGKERKQSLVEAGQMRLRPVLMTALVASLGFIPMAINTGAGAEVQKPLATVVIGGILTSTLLTLVVLPALYQLVYSVKKIKSPIK